MYVTILIRKDVVCVYCFIFVSLWNHLQIPVYRGAASALTSEGFTGSHYHGNDGLGDTDLEIDVQPQGMLQPVDATRGLIDMTFKHPG